MTVVDDRLARVGSANLNNRSCGFDTEMRAGGRGRTTSDRAAASRAFRDRLVGHFMGCTGDAVAKARAEHGGPGRAAIDALNREGRLRADRARREMTPLGEFIAAYHLGDPADVADSWRPWPPARAAVRRGAGAGGAAAPPLGQLEVHHQRQVVRGHAGQRVERREDVLRPRSRR